MLLPPAGVERSLLPTAARATRSLQPGRPRLKGPLVLLAPSVLRVLLGILDTPTDARDGEAGGRCTQQEHAGATTREALEFVDGAVETEVGDAPTDALDLIGQLVRVRTDLPGLVRVAVGQGVQLATESLERLSEMIGLLASLLVQLLSGISGEVADLLGGLAEDLASALLRGAGHLLGVLPSVVGELLALLLRRLLRIVTRGWSGRRLRPRIRSVPCSAA